MAPTLSKKENFAVSPIFSLKVDFAVVYLPSICLFVSLLRVCVPFLCSPCQYSVIHNSGIHLS